MMKNDQLEDVYTNESKRIAEKIEQELEVELRKWIADVLREPYNPNESIVDYLKSGVRLLKLINIIQPNTIPKINESKLPFQQMENISKYIKACEQLGMNEATSFQTVDLFEGKNINQVINNIHHLAFIASSFPTFKGPHFSSSTATKPTSTSNTPTRTPSRGGSRRQTAPSPQTPINKNNSNTNVNSNTSATNTTLSSASSSNNSVARSDSPKAHKPIQFTSSPNYLQQQSSTKKKIIVSKNVRTPLAPQKEVPSNAVSSVPSPQNSASQNREKKVEKKIELPKIASVSSLDNDISTKQLFKFDPEMEKAAIDWICEVTKVPIKGTLHEYLKDGVVLCKLLNAIIPGTVKSINESKMSFKQRENIAAYLRGCEDALGLKSTFLFQTVDLYEEKNMLSVITHIHVVARNAAKLPSYKGPQIRQCAAQSNPLFIGSFAINGLPEIVENAQISEEEQSLIDWTNSHLAKRNLKIQRLRSGLRNGVNLINLLEELTGTHLGVYEKTPSNLWHAMQNAALILKFVNQQTGERVIGCTGPDITTGRYESIVILCNLIRSKFDRDYVFKSQNLTEDSCRIKILEELLDTEKTYVRLMCLLCENIISPVKAAGEVPAEEQENIFSNMGEIFNFHKGILESLERRIVDSSVSLADIFLSRNNFVELYSRYVNNFDMASLMVKYNMKKYKSLKKIINKFETEQKEASGLDLSSFLILPVQRLPRYVLLLKELQRYTPENHPEYSGLVKAINHIAHSLEVINENKREHEQSTHKILNIDKSMVYEMEDFEGIVHPKRQYLYEGVLKWEEQYEEHPYWFLFNDILVYCAQLFDEDAPPNKQFRYVTLMPLRFIDEIKSNADNECSFDITMEDEIITLEAENVEQKEQWMKAVIGAKNLKVDLDLVW